MSSSAFQYHAVQLSAYQIIGGIYSNDFHFYPDEKGSMYLKTEAGTYRTTQRHNHETTP